MGDRTIPLTPEHRHALLTVEAGVVDEVNELSPSVIRALSDGGLIERRRTVDPWELTDAGRRRLAGDTDGVAITFARPGAGPPTRPSRRRWGR